MQSLEETAKQLGLALTRKGGKLVRIEQTEENLVVKYLMRGAIEGFEAEETLNAPASFSLGEPAQSTRYTMTIKAKGDSEPHTHSSFDNKFWEAHELAHDKGFELIVEDSTDAITFKLLRGTATMLLTDDVEMVSAYTYTRYAP